MDIVGLSPDGNYVEVIEIKEHPYFLAVQFILNLKADRQNLIRYLQVG